VNNKPAVSHPQDWRPVPDPTVLTTQQLLAAVSAVRELLETRLDAMDSAIELQRETVLNRIPIMIDRTVKGLHDLHEEKFASIKNQFAERDTRAEQTSRDSKVAVDAALQAAKEAVAKNEMVTVKQIDQQQILIHSTTGALNDKIDDIKDRLTLIEGKGFGLATSQSTQQSGNNLLVAIAATAIALLSMIATVIFAIIK
jgi:hypothetical protein